MRRISLIILAALALTLLISAQSQTPPSKNFKLTTAQQQEYLQLVKSKSGKAAIEAWARKHKLQIASLKNYDIIVIPEQGFENPTVQEATQCDASKCPVATGSYSIVNTLGKITGYQGVRCKARSCKWVKDSQGRNQRICGDWKCENEGPPISIQ